MKNVIVTGAAGNLGNAVTKHMLDKGFRVIATVHKEASLKELPSHDNLHAQVVDLQDEEKAKLFVEESMAKYGTIHAALLLVGGFAMGSITNTGIADIRHQLSLNFETAFNAVKPLLPHMLNNNNGKIVLIGSRPALQTSAGKSMVAYAMSKTLVFSLAEYINHEGKGKNVTATVVVPSTIDTPPNRQAMPDAHYENWVTPESLAEIIHFVVSDAAAPLRETVLKVYNNS